MLEDRLEAGLALEGWEVKSLRAGKVQMVDSYVLLKNDEALLFGCLITPLPTASTHIQPDPSRTRKLLLHRDEIDRLIGAVERKGYSTDSHGHVLEQGPRQSWKSPSPRAKRNTTSAPI